MTTRRPPGTVATSRAWVGYIANERALVSLATVDLAASERVTEVTVLWGEERNSRKAAVEPHRQVEIRATVAPVPYARSARESHFGS